MRNGKQGSQGLTWAFELLFKESYGAIRLNVIQDRQGLGTYSNNWRLLRGRLDQFWRQMADLSNTYYRQLMPCAPNFATSKHTPLNSDAGILA